MLELLFIVKTKLVNYKQKQTIFFSRTYSSGAIIIVVASIVLGWLIGCIEPEQAGETKMSTRNIEVLFGCEEMKELEKFYAPLSLGSPEIQTANGVTVVQTFPYSGLRASHLYIYMQRNGRFVFYGFMFISNNEKIAIQVDNAGDTTVLVKDVRVAILPSEMTKSLKVGKEK